MSARSRYPVILPTSSGIVAPLASPHHRRSVAVAVLCRHTGIPGVWRSAARSPLSVRSFAERHRPLPAGILTAGTGPRVKPQSLQGDRTHTLPTEPPHYSGPSVCALLPLHRAGSVRAAATTPQFGVCTLSGCWWHKRRVSSCPRTDALSVGAAGPVCSGAE